MDKPCKKKRALIDAVKDPVVKKTPVAGDKIEAKSSHRLRDVAIATVSVVIGIIGGILLSRFTRIL